MSAFSPFLSNITGSYLFSLIELFSLIYLWKWKSLSRVQLFVTPMDCPWNSLGQNTGVGSLSLLQGIFSTQGSNPGLLHCKWIFYQLSHKGSPRILEWVAFPFSRGSSQPRDQTQVSWIADGFFTNWAIRKAPLTCRTMLRMVTSNIICLIPATEKNLLDICSIW